MKQLTLIIFLSFPILSLGQENWIMDNSGCKILNPTEIRIRNFKWTGNCEDGTAEGEGKIVLKKFIGKPKVVFEGIVVKGKAKGKGNCKLSKQTSFEGIFKEGNISEGTITEILKYSTSIQKGKFINNKLTGEGEITLLEIYTHTGEYQNGLENGYGKRNFNNGDTLVGNFKDGSISEGKFFLKIYNFQIESDNWEMLNALSGTITYFEDSTIYEGELRNSYPHGIGTFIYNNGDKYYGDWKRGKQHGKGLYTCFDGTIYDTGWRKGQIHGWGRVIYPDKRVNVVRWKRHVLVREIEGYKQN